MKKGIIFDFDGVIINSHNLQIQSLEKAYQSAVGEGDIPYDDFFDLSGDSLENIFLKLGFPSKMLSIYRDFSRNNIDLIQIHEGIIEILEDIINKKCIIVLCTGKERLRTCEILKKFELENYFDEVICSDDIKNPKPNPESINIVINKYQISKEHIIMVGDGINDIKCARNAGISSIGVLWGDTPPQKLIVENPDIIVKTINELKYVINDYLL